MSDDEGSVKSVNSLNDVEARAMRGVSPVCEKGLHSAAKGHLKTKLFNSIVVKMLAREVIDNLRKIRKQDRQENKRQTKPERVV